MQRYREFARPAQRSSGDRWRGWPTSGRTEYGAGSRCPESVVALVRRSAPYFLIGR